MRYENESIQGCLNMSSANALGSSPVIPASPAWVVCLCADWCGLCRDYRRVIDDMARRYPAMRFVWLDIEDQADLVGEIDVETFPTVLLADAQCTWFLGPLPPQAQNLARLLDSLERASLQASPHSPATRQLLQAVQAAPEYWVAG